MRKNFFSSLIGGILAIVLLTGAIAVGVKIGNNGLKQSIKEWKDDIKNISSTQDDPSSSTPSTTSSSSESTLSTSASGALVINLDLQYLTIEY